jgi:putative FmdB family regulatory protein
MPTYEYACEACGHAFEEFQSMSAKPIKKCPKCGKNKVQRLISGGAGFIFKGSGFYETDYRSPTYQAAAKADTAAATATPAQTESKPAAPAKSESKPASKSSKSAA